MQEPRIILAAILKENGEIDDLKLGRIEWDKRCDRMLSPEDAAIWQHFAENGGGHRLTRAWRQYTDHRFGEIRQNGGTIVTVTSLHGRTTTTRRTFPPPKTTQGRVRATVRAPRPRARRTSSSSATAGCDPGDPDLPPRASAYLTLAEVTS